MFVCCSSISKLYYFNKHFKVPNFNKYSSFLQVFLKKKLEGKIVWHFYMNCLAFRLPGFQAEHGVVVCKLMELMRHYNLSMETKNDDDLEEYLDSICKKW